MHCLLFRFFWDVIPHKLRDELFNAIIDRLKKEGLTLKLSEVANSIAVNMVYTVRDVLCYLDEHCSTLVEHSCPVPRLFSIADTNMIGMHLRCLTVQVLHFESS